MVKVESLHAGTSPRPSHSILVALLAAVPVIGSYVWFATTGTWRSWPGGTTYYDQLANAFRAGHAWLDAKPEPLLLALADPYDPSQRQNVPHLWDASLFEGRYYLYFGPVPALLLTAAKTIHPMQLRDVQIAFAFTCGIFFMLELLILRIWKRGFADIPALVVACMIAAVGLMHPYPWSLGNRAWVHDSAIAAGTFFFLAGLYAALLSLADAKTSGRWALAAGCSWGLAIGSRMAQLVPVLFVVALVFLGTRQAGGVRAVRSVRRRVIPGLALPLAIAIAALGLYNYSRFRSVFEFGQTYQLAFLNLHANSTDIFSFNYVVQNLHNYLFMPPKLRLNFPWIWMQMGIRRPLLPGLGMPPLYFSEIITGLLYTTPVLVLALLPVIWRRRGPKNGGKAEPSGGAVGWLEIALGGSALATFAFFLCYFWASTRFSMDFLPSVHLLGLMGFWRLERRWRQVPIARVSLLVLGTGLLAASVLISLLLAIGLNASEFRKLNPEFWMQLNNLLRP
ncbi:MAG TPA: hypothetical protein VLL49_00290 [Anaerolineales bacterium]|nr:hypothetical protein [Anaerolineales bacterium]